MKVKILSILCFLFIIGYVNANNAETLNTNDKDPVGKCINKLELEYQFKVDSIEIRNEKEILLIKNKVEQEMLIKSIQLLKESWCKIAGSDANNINKIVINDEMNASVNESFSKPTYLLYGYPLLIKTGTDEYSEAKYFILAHEYGHYINKDKRNRKLFGFLTYFVFICFVAIWLLCALFWLFNRDKLPKLNLWKFFYLFGSVVIVSLVYYLNYMSYIKDELDADAFAIKLLMNRMTDYQKATKQFMTLTKLNEVKEPPDCFDLRELNKNISVEKRNPHPSIKDRETQIKRILENK